MALSDLNIKKLYQTRQEDVVEKFIAPALKESSSYDRGSGYFSLGALAEIVDGLIPFIKHGGNIRIVTSVELSEEDAKIFHEGLSLKDRFIVEKVHSKIIETITDEASILKLDVITNLIAAGRLSLKIAYMPDGIYHEKIGLFKDQYGNKIYFSGSNNATVSGLRKNWENVMVLTSWWGDQELIEEQDKYFNDLWLDEVDGLEVISFPEAEKRHLLNTYKKSPDVDTAVNKLVEHLSTEGKMYHMLKSGH